jgi:chemotaxis response regulator CheB
MAKKSKRVSRIRAAVQREKISTRVDTERLASSSEKLEGTIKQIEETARQLHRTIGESHGGAHLAHIQATKGRQKQATKGRQKQATKGRAEKTQVITKFPIVGIGASAGGLEAVTRLLKSLPPDTGMAFVLVQHLDPTRESALSSLLARATAMPVTEARDNVPLEPNHLYIIPPNKSIGISERRLKLFPRRPDDPEHLAIDLFFNPWPSRRATTR